jgi:galactokinase
VTRRFWAPGRVNLIGEFTDLAGGVALPVALDLGITLVAEPAPTIELHSRELDELVSLAADGSGDAVALDGWDALVLEVHGRAVARVRLSPRPASPEEPAAQP